MSEPPSRLRRAVLALVGGALADAFDRRRLVALAETGAVIRSVRRGEQCSTPCNARRLPDDSDEWHRRVHGKRVYTTTMMIRQFQYPKVTPIRPGSGTGPKVGGTTGGGSRPRG